MSGDCGESSQTDESTHFPSSTIAPSQRRTIARIQALLASAVHLALALWVFAPCLKPGIFPYGRDTVSHDILFFDHGWSTVRATGLVPLWNHHLFAGWPWVAAAGWTPWYPPHWIALFAPIAFAFTLQYLLHHAWAGLGFTMLGRALGLSFGASLLGGVLFQMSGHFTTLVFPGHLAKFEAIAWMPWILGASVRSCEGAKARWALWAGVCLAMQVLTQHAQIVYYTLGLVAALAAVRWCDGGVVRWCDGAMVRWSFRRSRVLALLGVTILAGASLAFVQLLPAAEMKRISNRAHGVAWEEAVDTSYPPEELAELAWPGLFGSSLDGTYHGRWGERLVSDYLGTVTLAGLLLALLFTIAPSPHRTIARSRALLLLALLALTLLLALGRFTPLYRLFYDWAPGWRNWRSPATIMCVSTFAACALAAMGWNALLARRVALARWLVPALVVLAAADQTRVARAHVNPVSQSLSRIEEGIAAGFVQVPRYASGSRLVLIGQEMSNTPMLGGHETITGYHPIVLRRWERLLQTLGYNNLVLHQLLGVRQWLSPRGQTLPPPFAPMANEAQDLSPSPPNSRVALDSAQWSYFVTPLLGHRLWRPAIVSAAATSAEAFERLRQAADQAIAASAEYSRTEYESIDRSSALFTAVVVGLPASDETEGFEARAATQGGLFDAGILRPCDFVEEVLDAQRLGRNWPEPFHPLRRYMVQGMLTHPLEGLNPMCVTHTPNAVIACLHWVDGSSGVVLLSEMVAPGWRVWGLELPAAGVGLHEYPLGAGKFRTQGILRPLEVLPAWGALWAVKIRGDEVAILAEYRPATVRLGLFVSLASLMVLLALFARLPKNPDTCPPSSTP